MQPSRARWGRKRSLSLVLLRQPPRCRPNTTSPLQPDRCPFDSDPSLCPKLPPATFTDDARQLYAFRRTLGQEDVLVVINRGSQPAPFTNPVLASRKYLDAFTQAAATKITVPAHDLVVLRAQ